MDLKSYKKLLFEHLRREVGDEQVMQAMADKEGYEFFDLRDVPIPPHVVELVPESVSRENAVVPLAEEEDGTLKVLVSDPFDYRADVRGRRTTTPPNDVHQAAGSKFADDVRHIVR